MEKSPAKAAWNDRICSSLASGNFSEAMTFVHQAFEEFPDDPDLLKLEEQVVHRRDRTVQAYQLITEGRQLCEEQKFEEGIEILREAYFLDELNATARSALVDNLLCYAAAIMETDLPLAERLAQEAASLDPASLVTQSVTRSIQEQKQDAALSKPAPVNEKAARDPKPPAAPVADEPPQTKKTAEELPDLAKLPSGTSAPAAKPPIAKQAAPAADAPPKKQTPPMPAAARELSVKPGIPVAAELHTPAPGIPPVPVRPAAAAPSQTSPGQKPPIKPRPLTSGPAAPRPAAVPRQSRNIFPFLMWALAICGLIVLVMDAGLILRSIRRHAHPAQPVSVLIHTSPPGATVRINGRVRDIGQGLSLAPGHYRIEALLDGYETAVQDVVLTPGASSPIEMTLLPMVPALQISADLASGVVFLDGQQVGQLENGQFALATLAEGSHIVRVTSDNRMETIIPFQVAPNEPPLVTGPISETNLHAALVSDYQNQARVYTGSDPISVQLDGQAIGKAAKGADLEMTGLKVASHEFVFGEGEDQRKLSLELGAGPSLFVSLSSDRAVGTLEIAANENGFGVLINGKPARVSLQRGRYYVYNVDAAPASVQVFKPGFNSEPAERTAVIRKGATVRLAFKLTSVPTTATLHLLGALPGTQVSIDGIAHDVVNGSLAASIPAGDHIVSLTREGYKPKSLRISAKAGQTIALGAADIAVDSPDTGELIITERSPANARVVLQRNGSEIAIAGREAEVPEGDYVLRATAPRFREFSHPVHISSTLSASAAIVLVAIPQTVRMEGWDDPDSWTLENGWYQHKGGSFVLFKPSAGEGTYEFTAKNKGRQLPFFRGGRIRWVLNYIDSQNYDLYELDSDKLSWKRIVDGKPGPQRQARHGVKIEEDTYKLVLEVGPGQFTGKLYDGLNWKALPQLDPGPLNSTGRFGFYLPGDDEISLADFVFKPKD